MKSQGISFQTKSGHPVNVNICNFAIFGLIFIKFSPKCRARKLGIYYISLGRFCSILNWEGADIGPQIWPRENPWSTHVKLITKRRCSLKSCAHGNLGHLVSGFPQALEIMENQEYH